MDDTDNMENKLFEFLFKKATSHYLEAIFKGAKLLDEEILKTGTEGRMTVDGRDYKFSIHIELD